MLSKLLIIDDSKLARMSAAKVLATLRPDWNSVQASNADEAVALASSEAVDIALLDFEMPGQDSLALAAELRELNCDMPLALVSANSQNEIAEGARKVGASFLGKPLTERQLRLFLDSAAARLCAR